jgi:hypothetical protein
MEDMVLLGAKEVPEAEEEESAVDEEIVVA